LAATPADREILIAQAPDQQRDGANVPPVAGGLKGVPAHIAVAIAGQRLNGGQRRRAQVDQGVVGRFPHAVVLVMQERVRLVHRVRGVEEPEVGPRQRHLRAVMLALDAGA